MLLLLLLLLLLPRGARAQTCIANQARCSTGSSVWWSGCNATTIGGGSISLAPTGTLSFLGTPINNILVAEKRSATLGTSGTAIVMPIWTTTLQAGPSAPYITGANYDTIVIRNTGYYEVALSIATWSLGTDVTALTMTVQESGTNRVVCTRANGMATAGAPNVASITCYTTGAAAAQWKVYVTSGTQICGYPNVDAVCSLYIRQLPVVAI